MSSFSVLSLFPPFPSIVMYCTDPGHVEHSTRTLSDPKLLVGTTIQYSCIPGYILQGGATLTCYGREPGTPVWTSRLPHCVCEFPQMFCPEFLYFIFKFLFNYSWLYFLLCIIAEESVSCENPGLPDNGYQILSKRLYLPGESLTFMCYQGYELIGEMAIKCILGNPSFWSGPLPLCRGKKQYLQRYLQRISMYMRGLSLIQRWIFFFCYKKKYYFFFFLPFKKIMHFVFCL